VTNQSTDVFGHRDQGYSIVRPCDKSSGPLVKTCSLIYCRYWAIWFATVPAVLLMLNTAISSRICYIQNRWAWQVTDLICYWSHIRPWKHCSGLVITPRSNQFRSSSTSSCVKLIHCVPLLFTVKYNSTIVHNSLTVFKT